MTLRTHPARFRQSHHHVVVSDESESQQPRKKRRLVKGKRPQDPELEAEDEDGNLIDEVDEDMIIDSRLRDRSKKSAFAKNLERLQRRRRGQIAISESEHDSDGSESTDPRGPAESEVFAGARPTRIILDHDDDNLDEGASEEKNDSDFIVEDDGAEGVPELPTMFSMGTFQDLSHHFKVICQLFVHLAVKESPGRQSFDYFSVPLAITRRKLFGIRDSLVTSSIWKPEFKTPLETFPIFRLERLEFSIPTCDACHISKRVATLRGVLSGHAYGSLTYEPRDDVEEPEEEGHTAANWNLGRFCAARAQVFHAFTHWEFILYHALRQEVDHLREATTQLRIGKKDGKRVFVPATNGPAPPGDLDDADGMMDWLDGRGVINVQWTKVKEMMERAHKLEAKGRGGDEYIELE
ncbi:hypothetical protein JB92DRAFT_2747549 [Gautieria morchelliformis]|nr:hypothetical protein JB92DRAFT_2747549 [Gautieria morchelliformis]